MRVSKGSHDFRAMDANTNNLRRSRLFIFNLNKLISNSRLCVIYRYPWAVNSEYICVYLTCSSVNFLSFQSTRNLLKDDPLTDSGCKTRSIRFWNIDTVTQLSLELNRNCYSNLPSSDSHACAAFPCMWLIIWFVLTCHLQYNILIMYHKNTWPEQQHVYPDCLLKKTSIHPITS